MGIKEGDDSVACLKKRSLNRLKKEGEGLLSSPSRRKLRKIERIPRFVFYRLLHKE